MNTQVKINPNDYFKVRRLKHRSHFLLLILIKDIIQNKLSQNWIELKLKTLFGKTLGLTTEDKVEQVLRVGFEDPKRAPIRFWRVHLKYK